MDNKHFDYRTLNPERLDWESFWNINESSIKETLIAKMKPYFDLYSETSYSAEERQESIEKRMNSEKEFVKLLLPKLKELLDQNKKVLILVDIDEAVAGKYLDRNQTYHTIIRPAFIKILELLEPYKEVGKITTGLLTSRSRPHEQLNDPEALAGIKQYINPNHLYTTTDYETHDNTMGELKKMAISPNSVLQPTLTEDNYQEMSAMGSIQKVRVLENIKSQISDFTTLVVDDFPYVKYLNKNNDLHGVHVNGEVVFLVD